MQKPTISVCLITKNEEKMLHDCLQSVMPFADEIILVDTGSTDKTKNIAEQFNARVYDFEWNNSFSDARNESIKYAKNEFILIIDADERIINPESVISTAINARMNAGGWTCDMISTFTTNGVSDKNITGVLRFFRNDKRFKFKGSIHEQIHNSIVDAGYILQKCDIKFNHLGYDLGEDAMAQKYNRNLDLLNKWLAEHPDDIYNLHHKAKTLLALNRFDEAETEFSYLLANSINDNRLRPQILNYAALCKYKNNKLDEALDLAKESLNIFPEQAFANFILGNIYDMRNDVPHALEAYLCMEKATEDPNSIAILHGEYYVAPEQMYWRIGRLLLAINDFQGAVAEFEKGLKIAPTDPFCLVGIANIAFKLKQFNKSKQALELALKYNPTHHEIVDFMNEIDKKLAETKQNDNIKLSNMQQNKKKLLSLCMIVKNEAEMLPGCLDSVSGIIDEIIIVDTGSTDSTVEIAKRYNAQVYYFDWVDDFAVARNESIKHATSDWILYLDADERLTPQSKIQIRQLIEITTQEVGGYFCLIESEHSKLDGKTEKHKGGYPRLFRNLGHPNIKFVGRVHEQISPSLIANNKNIIMSDLVIEHLGYNLPYEEMQKKVQRNYKMLLAHIKEEPTNAYSWFQLGQTLGQMQLFDEAEEATLFAIKCGNMSDSIYASATATLSQFAGRKKDYENALKWADETLKKVPNQLFGLSLKAHSLLYMGCKAESVEYFMKAIELLHTTHMIPRTGFDVEISEDVLRKGLEEALNN